MSFSVGDIARRALRLVPAELARPFGRPVAMFFHGVERRADDPLVRINSHDSDRFHDIAWQLRRNFDVLPLAELSDVLRAPKAHKRTMFLMSDDGYANTQLAADILSDLKLPWTLFVSTYHIDSGARVPLFLARLFFRFAPVGEYDLPQLGRMHLGGPAERDAIAVAATSRLRRMAAPQAEDVVAAMMANFTEAARSELCARFPSDGFLNWAQVRALKARGVEIGAHAHVHWAMNASQGVEYLMQQARLSRARIEQEVGACRYFAYPFGNLEDVCAAAWQAVREAGFAYGFTTLAGSLDASGNPFLMPRYGLAAEERNLAGWAPLLRLANRRLRTFQRSLQSDAGCPEPVQAESPVLKQVSPAP